jgi:hypothetical protein
VHWHIELRLDEGDGVSERISPKPPAGIRVIDFTCRLGIGYEALSRHNPEIVYCAVSGFGQSGPKALRPAYAPIVHAASGYDLAPFQFPGMDLKASTRVAGLGEDAVEVLGRLLGYSAEQAIACGGK